MQFSSAVGAWLAWAFFSTGNGKPACWRRGEGWSWLDAVVVQWTGNSYADDPPDADWQGIDKDNFTCAAKKYRRLSGVLGSQSRGCPLAKGKVGTSVDGIAACGGGGAGGEERRSNATPR